MPVTRSARKLTMAVYSVILLALSGCYDPYYVGGDGYQTTYRRTVVSYQQPWYDYDYYPSVDVYFNSGTGYYYHHDHGRWNHVRRLPRHIRIHDYDRVRLRLHGDRPYLYHDEHRRKYKKYRNNHKHRYGDDRYSDEWKHDRRYKREYKDERKHDKHDSRRRDKYYKREYLDEREFDKRGHRDGNKGTKRGSRELDNIDTHYFELYKKQLNEKDQRRKKKKQKQKRNRDERKYDKRSSHRDVNKGSKRGSGKRDNIDTHYFEPYNKQSKEEAQKRKEKKQKKKQEQERNRDKNRDSEKNAKNSGWYLQK